MKKLVSALVILGVSVFSTACGTEESNSDAVKVGISSGDTRTWDYIVELAEEEGLKIELVKFSDYVQPNLSLDEGEIDANAFQTVAYFDEFVAEHNLELSPIGATVIAPMGIYSKKYDDIRDIPDGATIAIPNDGSNGGRALLLLQEAGLITLSNEFDGFINLEYIEENPKKLKIETIAAGNTPRFLDDVDASIINNNFALEAGLMLTESLFHESETAKPYVNLIAVKTGDEDRPELQKLVELYHSDEVEQFIKDTYQGNLIPAYISVDELVNYKDAWN